MCKCKKCAAKCRTLSWVSLTNKLLSWILYSHVTLFMTVLFDFSTHKMCLSNKEHNATIQTIEKYLRNISESISFSNVDSKYWNCGNQLQCFNNGTPTSYHCLRFVFYAEIERAKKHSHSILLSRPQSIGPVHFSHSSDCYFMWLIPLQKTTIALCEYFCRYEFYVTKNIKMRKLGCAILYEH